jgi:hypothetical protein
VQLIPKNFITIFWGDHINGPLRDLELHPMLLAIACWQPYGNHAEGYRWNRWETSETHNPLILLRYAKEGEMRGHTPKWRAADF